MGSGRPWGTAGWGQGDEETLRRGTTEDTDRAPGPHWPAAHRDPPPPPRPGEAPSLLRTGEPEPLHVCSQRAWACRPRRGHVTLTSRTWSSLLGMTRTCVPAPELKTWPGGSACRRGMGKPWCSLLLAECAPPLLLPPPPSGCSSPCLSTDRLSFSIQLSAKRTLSETEAARPRALPSPPRPSPTLGAAARSPSRWPGPVALAGF